MYTRQIVLAVLLISVLGGAASAAPRDRFLEDTESNLAYRCERTLGTEMHPLTPRIASVLAEVPGPTKRGPSRENDLFNIDDIAFGLSALPEQKAIALVKDLMEFRFRFAAGSLGRMAESRGSGWTFSPSQIADIISPTIGARRQTPAELIKDLKYAYDLLKPDSAEGLVRLVKACWPERQAPVSVSRAADAVAELQQLKHFSRRQRGNTNFSQERAIILVAEALEVEGGLDRLLEQMQRYEARPPRRTLDWWGAREFLLSGRENGDDAIQIVDDAAVARALKRTQDEPWSLEAIERGYKISPTSFAGRMRFSGDQFRTVTARLENKPEVPRMRIQNPGSLAYAGRYVIVISFGTSRARAHEAITLNFDRRNATNDRNPFGRGSSRRTVRYSAIVEINGEYGELVALIHQRRQPSGWQSRDLTLKWVPESEY